MCVYASDVGVHVGGWLCMSMGIRCLCLKQDQLTSFSYVVVRSRTACEMKHTLKVEPTGR